MLNPSHSRAWIGASLKQHATGRFTAPFVIKDHLKAGLKFDKYLGLLGQRAVGRYILPPAPSTNLYFLNASAHQSPEEEAVTALQALEKITFFALQHRPQAMGILL